MAEQNQGISNKTIERNHLENRFDEIINGLWCEEEKLKYLGMKDEILKDISDDELKERLDKFQTSRDNMELVEKYLTIALTNTMNEAENIKQPDLEDYILSAEGDLFRIFIGMIQTLDDTGDIASLQNDEVDLKNIIFGKRNPKHHECEVKGIFREQVCSPLFNFKIRKGKPCDFTDSSNQFLCNNEDLDTKTALKPPSKFLINPELTGPQSASDQTTAAQRGDGVKKVIDANLRLKEYDFHINYIALHLNNYYDMCYNQHMLTNVTPNFDYNTLRKAKDKNPYSNKSKSQPDISEADTNLFSKDLMNNKLERPYTNDKIKYYFWAYAFQFCGDLGSDQRNLNWLNVIADMIIDIQFSIIQTLRREILSALGFPTLIPQNNPLTNLIFDLMNHTYNTESCGQYLLDLLDYTRFKQCTLKREIDKGQKWVCDNSDDYVEETRL